MGTMTSLQLKDCIASTFVGDERVPPASLMRLREIPLQKLHIASVKLGKVCVREKECAHVQLPFSWSPWLPQRDAY
jgi:hypothetical protein